MLAFAMGEGKVIFLADMPYLQVPFPLPPFGHRAV
jgi:hypothetical protein